MQILPLIQQLPMIHEFGPLSVSRTEVQLMFGLFPVLEVGVAKGSFRRLGVSSGLWGQVFDAQLC